MELLLFFSGILAGILSVVLFILLWVRIRSPRTGLPVQVGQNFRFRAPLPRLK